MVAVGASAPQFGCTAVVDGELAELAWDVLREGRALVLLFDSLQSGSDWRGLFAVLSACSGRLERARGKIALVCRDDLADTLLWLERFQDEEGPAEVPLPIVIDADGRIARRCGFVDDDGEALWGRFLIDAEGTVRDLAIGSAPCEPDVADLLRRVESARASPGCGGGGPCGSELRNARCQEVAGR
ncbi:MAG: hypothetical protein WD069_14945 [Planctomycetales bacterium]